MTFYFFVRGGQKREGRAWHKVLEGRWQQECELYCQDLSIRMHSLRSAQESCLFFPLIISYCQLRLVVAAYSLLFVNSVGPHSKLRYKLRVEAMARSLV